MILNYIHWNPNPEIINVLGISILYYGLLFVTGLIICLYILGWIFKKENIPQANLEKLSIYGMIGILAGARLGHCLFYEPDYYFAHPVEMILPLKFINGEIEFIKERQVEFEESMKLDMGQLLSIPYIIIGIGFMTYGIQKTKKISRSR